MVEEKSVVERAQEIYETKLRFTLETPENIGNRLSIDVDSEDYKYGDEDDMKISTRLRTRHPQARTMLLRIGYNAVYAIGGTVERIER